MTRIDERLRIIRLTEGVAEMLAVVEQGTGLLSMRVRRDEAFGAYLKRALSSGIVLPGPQLRPHHLYHHPEEN